MKKLFVGILLIIIIGSVCFLGFDYKKSSAPNRYYQVYMNNKVLGIIKSKKELEDYINENGNYYKSKYKVDKVYAPN